jgi:hypothetical protein
VVGRPYIQPENRKPGEFKLALSDIYGPFDIRSDPLSVKAGTSTRVRFGFISIELTDSDLRSNFGICFGAKICFFETETFCFQIFLIFSHFFGEYKFLQASK